MKRPLDYVEEEAADLTEKMEQAVRKFKDLGLKISPHTKHQLFCS